VNVNVNVVLLHVYSAFVTNSAANRERTRVHASLDCISCLHLPPQNLTLVYTALGIDRYGHGRAADAQCS
jgi:hypothetical protein